jgi:hypothetical protein
MGDRLLIFLDIIPVDYSQVIDYTPRKAAIFGV